MELQKADAVVLLTDHCDFSKFVFHSTLIKSECKIFDFRRALNLSGINLL